MKKRMLFLGFTLSGILSAQAQGNEESPKPQQTAKNSGLVINPGISLGMGSVAASDPSNAPAKAVISVQPGINLGYRLNPHIAFFTGLAYSSNGFKQEESILSIPSKVVNRNEYLEVPLLVRISTGKPHKIGLVADAGVSAGFLLSSRRKIRITEPFTNRTGIITLDSKDDAKKTAVSGLLFLGVKIPVSPVLTMIPGLDGQYTFTDMLDPAKSQASHLYRIGFKVSASIQLTNY